jgi:site-specific DNA-methyltransferase (adenine-specific)
MKRIPDGSVDAIITDLPYGTTSCAWDSVIPFEPLWEQYRRVCKPNAAIVLFGSEPFSSALRMSNMEMYGYDWIWQKQRPTNFYQVKWRPLKEHETISVFYQHKPTYNPQGTKACNIKNGRKQKSGKLYATYNGGDYVQTTGNYPRSILKFSTDSDSDRLHPTQKPVDLIAYLVRTYTNEGDTVLDNCSGSGTTAVACVKEKRHFICFEKDETYWKKSVERVKNEQRQLTLF